MVAAEMRGAFLRPLVLLVLMAGCIHVAESCVSGTLYWTQAGLYEEIADKVQAYTTQPRPGWPAEMDVVAPANWTSIAPYGRPGIELVPADTNMTRIRVQSDQALSGQQLRTMVKLFFEDAAPRFSDDEPLAEALARNRSFVPMHADPPPGGTIVDLSYYEYLARWSVAVEPHALAEKIQANGGNWRNFGFPGVNPQNAALENATLRMDVSAVLFRLEYGSTGTADLFAGSSLDVFGYRTDSGHRSVVKAGASDLVESMGAALNPSTSLFDPYPNPCR